MGLVKMSRPRAYVALYHSIDATKWKQQYEEGGPPADKTPYGFHLAEEQGFDVIFARDAPRRAKGGFSSSVMRLLGFDVMHAWTNRRRIAKADIVWTITEGERFAIAFLFACGYCHASRSSATLSGCWMNGIG
jgi:hypothetical protein